MATDTDLKPSQKQALDAIAEAKELLDHHKSDVRRIKDDGSRGIVSHGYIDRSLIDVDDLAKLLDDAARFVAAKTDRH